MDQSSLFDLLKKDQATLEHLRFIKYPPDQSGEWTHVFVRFGETAKALLDEKDGKKVNSEQWKLEAFQSILNEIDQSLQFIKASEYIRCPSSIMTIILNILWSSFKYCQALGNNNENEINENLASFFKLSYQSLKMVIDVLENHSEMLFNRDENILQNTLIPLINCSKVLADIDIMASVAVWKSIKKLFNLHKDLILKNSSEFESLFEVCHLACQSFNVYFELIEKKDVNMINKYQKVIRFFLGIVLLIVKELKKYMNVRMCSQVYELIHLIQKQSLINTRKKYDAKDCLAEYESMSNMLLCVNDPLIKDFIEVVSSSNSVVNKVCDNESIIEDDSVVYLMDLLSFIEYLTEKPEHIDPWMKVCTTSQKDIFEETSYFSILDFTFSYVHLCTFEIFGQRMENAVLHKSKCFQVSLYEIVLGKLCAFITALPQKYFVQLETLMLSNLITPQSKYCALLASDLWCYVSRWGKPEMCLNHVIFLGKLLIDLHKNNVSQVAIDNLSRLMQRLFWFLQDHHHDQIVVNFPVNVKNVVIWKVLPVTHLKISNTLKFCSDFVETVLSLIEMKDGSQNNEHDIVCAIDSLTNIVTSNEIYGKLPIDLKNHIYNHIIEFWSCFRNVDKDIDINESLVLSMLSLTSEFLSFLNGNHLYDILTVISDILYNTDNRAFHTMCSYFLVHLKNINFHPEVERNCLTATSKIFQFLLNHKDVFIDCQTMKALKMFAEETVYSRSLVTFLPQSRKKDFTNYLRKEVLGTAVEYKRVFEMAHVQNDDVQDELMLSKNENDIEGILNVLEKNANTLKGIISNSISSDYKSRVRTVISLLENSCS